MSGAEMPSAGSMVANGTAAAVTVSAGGDSPDGVQAASNSTSASAAAINSATLTPGGLAATTTSAVASAVTVQAEDDIAKIVSSTHQSPFAVANMHPRSNTAQRPGYRF